jgi:hypothetical protein
LDWRRFDQEWAKRESFAIMTLNTDLSLAKRRLDIAAFDKQREAFEIDIKILRAHRDLIERVGLNTSSGSLQNSAEAISGYIKELTELARNWPPLDDPSAEQLERLKKLRSDIAVRLPSISTTVVTQQQPLLSLSDGLNFGLVESKAPRHSASQIIDRLFKDNPTAVAVSLNRYCDDRLVGLIADSKSEAETDKLHRAMGGQFEYFYNDWQERLREQAEEARRREDNRVAHERQLAIEHQKQVEHERVQEERAREVSHPVEIP